MQAEILHWETLPGREGWQIEIPSANGKKLMLLKNCGITTSGATYRYLELDGKRYSHIIDPEPGSRLYTVRRLQYSQKTPQRPMHGPLLYLCWGKRAGIA
jgi:hypothetical protein